jgi:hypothetical protein
MTTEPGYPSSDMPRPAEDADNEPPSCHDTVTTIPHTAAPSCHDTVTMTCPICQQPFTPTGRQKFCSDACRAAAYRRRRDAGRPALTIPKNRPRRPITIYECDRCGTRALGDQYCPDCSTFMRKIGLGGECPHCAEPLAVTELLAQEVIDSP